MRWNLIRDAVDSRTDEERESGSVPKSRYSGMNHFLSDHPNFTQEGLNDVSDAPTSQEFVEKLEAEGLPNRLATHFASLFGHDALCIYKGHTDLDMTTTEHFEQFQSTNWNSIRLKPPPSLTSSIGWRVEFRTLDVQLTDYENAAFIALLHLLVSLVNSEEHLNTAMPISKCDENLERAHSNNAIGSEKFWWPTNLLAKS